MECVCLRCGWRWKARKGGRPKWCPGCHSQKWDQSPERSSERSRVIKIQVSEEEKRILDGLAGKAGMPLRDYMVRMALEE